MHILPHLCMTQTNANCGVITCIVIDTPRTSQHLNHYNYIFDLKNMYQDLKVTSSTFYNAKRIDLENQFK